MLSHLRPAALRRRPKAALLALALLLLVAAAAGLNALALLRWHEARRAVLDRRPQDARSALQLPLLLWGRSPPVRLLAARAARMSGDFPEAEALLTRLLASPAAREDAQLEFLLMRVQAGDVEEVEAPLLHCVENGHAEAPLILETLAGAHMRNLRFTPALLMLNRWIEVDPSSAVAHQHRAWLLDRANKPREALKDYRRAVDLAPDLVPPRLRLAEMLLQENEPADAAPHLERLHAAHPKRPDVLARLGQCRFQQGEFDEARRLLLAAEEGLPDDPAVLIHLARIDQQSGRLADAERRLRRVLEGDPADAEAQYTLVQVIRRLGRTAEADAAEKNYHRSQDILRRVNTLLRDDMEASPTDAGTPYEAGRGLLELGQERLGLYYLHQALKRDPGHRPTHAALAAHYDAKGIQDRAAHHRRQMGLKP